MSKQALRDGRGGARSGSGPRRRRLYLDADTARLLSVHMKRLRVSQPNLSEEEAVRALILAARTHQESAYTEVLQVVQDILSQHWQPIVQQILSNAGSQLEALLPSIVNQLHEAVSKRLVSPGKPEGG